MANGPIEPAAAPRAMANLLRGMYIALQQEGFTEDQCMQLLGHTLAAAFAAKKAKE